MKDEYEPIRPFEMDKLEVGNVPGWEGMASVGTALTGKVFGVRERSFTELSLSPFVGNAAEALARCFVECKAEVLCTPLPRSERWVVA